MTPLLVTRSNLSLWLSPLGFSRGVEGAFLPHPVEGLLLDFGASGTSFP